MAEVRTIETFVVDAIKDIEVPQEIPGCPLSSDARRLLLANCPVYLIDPTEETASYLSFNERPQVQPEGIENPDIWQPGPNHKRSFGLSGNKLNEVWKDEHGNQYSSFTLKGINFTNPGIVKHPVSTDGVVAWGLQESKIIGRVLAAADVLAKRGVSSERIVGLAEPKEYPWPIIDGHTDAHEYVSLGTYKQRIVEKYWRDLQDDEQSLESFADLTKKFSDMTFLISLRVADTAFRLSDIKNVDTRYKVFTHINKHYIDKSDDSYDEPFEILGSGEAARYVQDFFAPRAGTNLAKLHVDLAHGFANGLNWTVLGGIVDLDSVHGESLGMDDTPVTNKERAKDIADTLSAIYIAYPGHLLHLDNPLAYMKLPAENFLKAYFDETIAQFGDSQETIEHLGEIISHLGPAFDATSGDTTFDDYKIKYACSYYFDRFYRYIDGGVAIAEARDSITEAITESLNVDERLAVKMGNRMYGAMDTYADLIMTDYISELADPAFDVVDQFKQDGKRSSAWSQLVQDITQELLLNAAGSEDLIKLAPDAIQQIKNHKVRELVMGVFMGDLWDDIKKQAEAITADNIQYIESTLRRACDYERPRPLLKGYRSELYPGIEYRRHLLSTQGVDLEQVQAYLKDFDGDIRVKQMPERTKQGEIVIAIRAQNHIDEIISFDGIDSASGGTYDKQPYLQMHFGAKNTNYVLLVGRTDSEKKVLYLFVESLAFNETKSSTEEGAPIQGQLFTAVTI